MPKKQKWMIRFGLCVLFGAIASVVYGNLIKQRTIVSTGLIKQLPKAPTGWLSTDQPIASTPEMQKAVNEMLNYDEAVFRTYSSNGISFSVYAAYWSPGRFHPRLISIHTPDVCWVGNGMTQVKADYNYQLKIDSQTLWHGQYREFTANGIQTNVVYWHILNGKPSGYAEGPNSLSQDFFATMWRDMHEGIGEQYFIRISSDSSIEKCIKEPVFTQILQHFGPILIKRDS